jgi:hypothetical protein
VRLSTRQSTAMEGMAFLWRSSVAEHAPVVSNGRASAGTARRRTATAGHVGHSHLRALSLPENALWVPVWLTVLGATGWFIWANRITLRSPLSLSPLSPTEHKPALLWLLFTIPLMLAILGANTIDVSSIRYLFNAWLASSIIRAVFIAKLASRSSALAVALAGLWVLQVGTGNLVDLGAYWNDRRAACSPKAVSTLEEFLTDHDVQEGYADCWIAYPLDYVTEERLTLAPYNGVDRYPRYSEGVASLPVHACLLPLSAIPD